MALKDKIALGVALPHRSPEPIDMEAVRRVAQRAEALGFHDLWVTENTLDHVFCFDPVVRADLCRSGHDRRSGSARRSSYCRCTTRSMSRTNGRPWITSAAAG